MPQFWKLGISPFWKGKVLQNSPQKLGEFPSTFFHPPDLIWGSLYARGVRYHLPFRGPIRLTNYNFHAHVQYCITSHYHICSIYKYINVESPKCHNFGRLGISCFEKEGFAKLTPKAGRVSSTFLLPPELIWGSPYARGVRYHQPFRGPIRLTNYNFHAHVQYCITIHYHSCSIDKYINVESPKCHNFGMLGISHFEKAGHLSSCQLRLTKCQADLM